MQHFPAKWVFAIAVAVSLSGALSPAIAQQAQSDAARKIVRKVNPEYPELARQMGLRGTVRMLVTVAPDGTPKSIRILGGHALLAQAAESGVYKWKWAAAPREANEPVEVKFATD